MCACVTVSYVVLQPSQTCAVEDGTGSRGSGVSGRLWSPAAHQSYYIRGRSIRHNADIAMSSVPT